MIIKFVVLLCLLSVGLQMSGFECDVRGCESCKAPNVCELCQQDFTLQSIEGSDQKVCIRANCPQNCLDCNSDNQCQSCSEGFLLTENGACESQHQQSSVRPTIRILADVSGNQTNCTLTGCSVCDDTTTCSVCKDGYRLIANKKCMVCPDNECAVCSQANVCSACKSSSFTPSAIGANCISCNLNSTILTGCAACDKENSCGRCSNGLQLFVPEDGNGICLKCSIQHCQKCGVDSTNSASKVCKKCINGFSISPSGTECVSCTFPCDTCTTAAGPNNCATCRTPLYYKAALENGTCAKKLVPGCQTVNTTDNSLCSNCEAGYTLSSDSSKCVWGCSQHCGACTNSSYCSQCVQGYYTQTSGACAKCTTKGCSVCTDSGATCTTCLRGFYLLNQECLKCPGYCSSCSGADVCTELVVIYQQIIIIIGGKTFLAICDTNCATCSNLNPSVCLECNDGFLLKNGKCKRCSGLCMTCDQTDKNVCLSCYPNTFLEGSSCVRCSSNCKTCAGVTSVNTCTSCWDGYYLSGTQCIEGCPENCFLCSSATTCTQCLSGYTLFNEDGQYSCAPCISSCRTCSEGQPASCLTCGSGFYLDGTTCTPCASNCDECTAAGCTTCSSGYFMTAEQTCAQNCELPCATCSTSSPTTCLTCIAGYAFNDQTSSCVDTISCDGACSVCPMGYSLKSGECIKCTASQCQSCNSDTPSECYSCRPRYYLSDAGSCTSCPSQCRTCLSETGCLTCAAGYTKKQNAVAKAGGAECVKCESPCLTCSGSPNFCTSCVDGYKFFGWKCGRKFRFTFKIKLMIIIKTFNLNFFKFLRVFAGAVKGKTNAITCNSIKEGSVDLEGSAAPSADPGSAEAADQLQALNDVIKSGEIAGMSVAESQLVVEEGSVGSSTSKDNVVGIVLGICIPIGVLIIVGIIVLIVYKKRGGRKAEEYEKPEGSDNRLDYSAKDSFEKI